MNWCVIERVNGSERRLKCCLLIFMKPGSVPFLKEDILDGRSDTDQSSFQRRSCGGMKQLRICWEGQNRNLDHRKDSHLHKWAKLESQRVAKAKAEEKAKSMAKVRPADQMISLKFKVEVEKNKTERGRE